MLVDAVAEIENKRPGTKLGKDLANAIVEMGAAGQEQEGVEIALHRNERLQGIPDPAQWLRGIAANGVDA